MSTPPCWILAGVRTPFAKAGGAFARTPAYELGRIAIAEVLAREDVDPARLDHAIFGNCAQQIGRASCRERV